MDTTLHEEDQSINLGMSYVNGSLPATKMKDLLLKRLKRFGLTMDQIIAIMSDAASVMKCLANLLGDKNKFICVLTFTNH